jgi:hypothetical protein
MKINIFTTPEDVGIVLATEALSSISKYPRTIRIYQVSLDGKIADPRPVTWTDLESAALLKFIGWNGNGILRDAVFQGPREVDPASIAKANRPKRAAAVVISNKLATKVKRAQNQKVSILKT